MNLIHKSKSAASQMFVACLLALAATGQAMAQTADFDPATVTAKITTYLGYGVVILGAMAVAVWTLKVFGLIGARK